MSIKWPIEELTVLHRQVSAKLPANRGRALLIHALVSSLKILTPSPDEPTPRMDADTKQEKVAPRATIRVLRPARATALQLGAFHDSAFVERLLDADGGVARDGDDEFGLEDVRTHLLTCGPWLTARRIVRRLTVWRSTCSVWRVRRSRAQRHSSPTKRMSRSAGTAVGMSSLAQRSPKR
jgi:hypothetical protein